MEAPRGEGRGGVSGWVGPQAGDQGGDRTDEYNSSRHVTFHNPGRSKGGLKGIAQGEGTLGASFAVVLLAGVLVIGVLVIGLAAKAVKLAGRALFPAAGFDAEGAGGVDFLAAASGRDCASFSTCLQWIYALSAQS